MSQLSLLDFAPDGPVLTVLEGEADRPRAWRVDYPGGRTVVYRRTSDPFLITCTEGGQTYHKPTWEVPLPADFRDSSD